MYRKLLYRNYGTAPENVNMAEKVIALVGAGGKTTMLHELIKRCVGEGKRVLATTSTHMFIEDGMDLSCDQASIIERIDRDGWCLAGRKSDTQEGKFTALPDEVYMAVSETVDVVIVEADGAKRYPAKLPREGEPVLPANVTNIAVVMGLAAVGKPKEEVIFRYDDMKDAYALKTFADKRVTRRMLREIIINCYLNPLKELRPDVAISCYFSYNEDGELRFKPAFPKGTSLDE